MDEVIKTYPFREFGHDLNYCYDRGIMYQRDMSRPCVYDKAYFDNYVDRENTEIANRLNTVRVQLAEKYCDCVLDVGVGSGEFIKNANIKVYGYDINPVGVAWLEERGLYVDIYGGVPDEVQGFTLWDTLEHMPNPQQFLRLVEPGELLFISLPIFANVEEIRQSKHYKPDEHLYYYTYAGLVGFMEDSGFLLLESGDAETRAGREGIGSFVFVRATA